MFQKGRNILTAVTLFTLNRFSKLSVRFFSKYAAKYLWKIPRHIICICTQPCETLMLENKWQSQTNAVISDKLKSTVVTYSRFGGIINNQMKTGLLPSLLPSVLWHCWLGIRSSSQPLKIEWWGVGVVICQQWCAHCLHMVQLMPPHPGTPSSLASFKSRLVLPFWYRLTQVVLEKRLLNECSGSSSSYSWLCRLAVWWPGAQSAQDNYILLVTLSNIHRLKKNFTGRISN